LSLKKVNLNRGSLLPKTESSFSLLLVYLIYYIESERKVIFRHPKAVQQLFRDKIVATMRTYRYKPGQFVIIKTIYGVFRGKVVDVIPNTLENRVKLYRISGFDDPEKWLMEAIKLHKKIPRYIVVVQMISSS